MRYTPGPWKYMELRDENGDEDGGVLLGVNSVVADYLHLNNPDDAQLIAAAPELFRILKQAAQYINKGIELGYINWQDSKDPLYVTPAVISFLLGRGGTSYEEIQNKTSP